MDIRRTRKNGWDEIINAYMNRLPKSWPYTSMVTDPRIRTTILEKTARLLNAKLQGRLVPREGGDIVKARINNAILDYQWDAADDGGSMIEKVAQADQYSRLFGAGFALVYWDSSKDCNELKVIDPRDIFWDFACTHARNAKWCQVREFTTWEALKDRGFDVEELHKEVQDGTALQVSDLRSTKYTDQVKVNRSLTDRTGEDLSNPTVEVVTEYTKARCVTFIPRYGRVIKDVPNPYKHKMIPIAQLRYYPLGDDIYGESEVEPVIALQRAINATLCGFLDEMNLSMRPPLEIVTGMVQMQTIEYGPGARWIVNAPGNVREVQMGGNAVQFFGQTYPALVAAFNTAMGDQSLGVSNVGGDFQQKTATEVASLEKQQNNRDQDNQRCLSEFLQDIMLMWLSNNKQYLFDDETKKYKIIKIVGKANIQGLQQMALDDKDIPQEAIDTISATIESDPNAVTDEILQETLEGVAMPSNPVVTNPSDEPEYFNIQNKLTVSEHGDEADLYVTPEDLEGVYDYIPDVKSMAAGAGVMQQRAREKALEVALNPQVLQMLAQQGETMKIKELLVNSFEDAGYRDAESLFQPLQPQTSPGVIPGGSTPPQAGGLPAGAGPVGGVPDLSASLPGLASPGGLPGPQGLPDLGQVAA